MQWKNTLRALDNEYEQVKAYTCYSAPTEKDLEMKNFDKEGLIEGWMAANDYSDNGSRILFLWSSSIYEAYKCYINWFRCETRAYSLWIFRSSSKLTIDGVWKSKNEVLFHLVFIYSRNNRFTVSRRIPMSWPISVCVNISYIGMSPKYSVNHSCKRWRRSLERRSSIGRYVAASFLILTVIA